MKHTDENIYNPDNLNISGSLKRYAKLRKFFKPVVGKTGQNIEQETRNKKQRMKKEGNIEQGLSAYWRKQGSKKF